MSSLEFFRCFPYFVFLNTLVPRDTSLWLVAFLSSEPSNRMVNSILLLVVPRAKVLGRASRKLWAGGGQVPSAHNHVAVAEPEQHRTARHLVLSRETRTLPFLLLYATKIHEPDS